MTAIPVVIVSTNALIRGGIQQIIVQPETRIDVTGMFASFSELSAFLKDHQARVFIMDDSLPKGVNLSKELKRLLEAHPGLAVILILQRPTPSLVQKVLAIGVRAILHKDDDFQRTLNQAIQLAVAGGVTISPRVSHLLEKQQLLPENLDQRDVDVFDLLTEGLQPKEIAMYLGVERKAVYRSIKKLTTVYDAQNLPQLVVLAQQHKMRPLKKRE
ncbi:MAG: putative NarL family two-component response regulator [Chloroflexi bacterium OLB13]|nr:MAG: putative NarL family two-component response regulator [Chloroflexi bacterium OLB13]